MGGWFRALAAALAFWFLASGADGLESRFVVRGGEDRLVAVPVGVEIKLPSSLARTAPERISVKLATTGGSMGVMPAFRHYRDLPGQVLRDADGRTQLWWVIPEVAPGSATVWKARFSRSAPRRSECFAWKDTPRRHLDLVFGGKGVTRYMYERDASTPRRAHETYKVYHHVFDLEGNGFITKGPHGLYTHHRGILTGWSKVGFRGGKYDLWHMKPKAVQLHGEFLGNSAGPVLARSTALIHWKTGDDGEVILAERRETTVYRQEKPALVLMDFVSALEAVTADVELNGDPEHAGFQFRPSNAISGKDEKGGGSVPLGRNRKATYLFHGEGVSPQKQKDLPWVAMSYALDGQPYSVIHMSHPDNPKGAVYSAYRDYGRFGCWTRADLRRGEKLSLRYRFWVGAAEMPSRETCAARHAAFASPPEVTRAR